MQKVLFRPRAGEHIVRAWAEIVSCSVNIKRWKSYLCAAVSVQKSYLELERGMQPASCREAWCRSGQDTIFREESWFGLTDLTPTCAKCVKRRELVLLRLSPALLSGFRVWVRRVVDGFAWGKWRDTGPVRVPRRPLEHLKSAEAPEVGEDIRWRNSDLMRRLDARSLLLRAAFRDISETKSTFVRWSTATGEKSRSLSSEYTKGFPSSSAACRGKNRRVNQNGARAVG